MKENKAVNKVPISAEEMRRLLDLLNKSTDDKSNP